VHDITAARSHALPALYRAAATGLPALADPGYDGAGIGIHIPVRQPADGRDLDINTRTRNALLRSLRCLGERGFALLTGRWRALQHITASPGKIGDIVRAALVLTHFEHGYQMKFAEITSMPLNRIIAHKNATQSRMSPFGD
jgi:DDE superfamily endonuclease